MSLRKTKYQGNNNNHGLLIALVAVLAVASVLHLLGFGTDCSLTAPSETLLSKQLGAKTASTTKNAPPSSSSSFQVPETCLQLPKIRPSGSVFFQNEKCNKAASKPELEPSFHVGTFFSDPNKIKWHMGGLSSYELIKEQVQSKNQAGSSVALDAGANQGFFTWYLAALGLEVHSFEINPNNFQALQHGILFNPPEIADRVNLYPMGLSNTIGRFGISGGDYRGFLKASDKGQILSVTMDCFAHHTSVLEKDIAVVKIDVEGFEIRVLQGAKQSLFSQQSKKIGALLVEVGPDRWSRSGATLEEGIETLQDVSEHFESSYVIFREGETCPGAKLKPALSPSSTLSRELHEVQLYKVAPSDWKPLLETMKTTGADCDFWYTNP
jgi:FkbM family methyltransferase